MCLCERQSTAQERAITSDPSDCRKTTAQLLRNARSRRDICFGRIGSIGFVNKKSLGQIPRLRTGGGSVHVVVRGRRSSRVVIPSSRPAAAAIPTCGIRVADPQLRCNRQDPSAFSAERKPPRGATGHAPVRHAHKATARLLWLGRAKANDANPASHDILTCQPIAAAINKMPCTANKARATPRSSQRLRAATRIRGRPTHHNPIPGATNLPPSTNNPEAQSTPFEPRRQQQ